MLGLLKDLYALRPETRAFFAAWLGVGSDPLNQLKRQYSQWTYPDLINGQDVSLRRAKKAIAGYRKAVGWPEGMVELCTFYCEDVPRLVGDGGLDDEAHFSALVRMFEQGLTQATELPPAERHKMLERLDVVRGSLRGVGWGVADAINEIGYDYNN